MEERIAALGDFEAGLECQAALRDLISAHPGGAEDAGTLARVKNLCLLSIAAVEDARCWEMLAAISGFADDLYSDHKHLKWGVGEMPGAECLRRMIGGSLSLLGRRLRELDAWQGGAQRARLAPAARQHH